MSMFIGPTVTNEELGLVEAAVGTTVTFRCRMVQDNNPVVWHHYPIGAKLAKIVYWEGVVFGAYHDRFRVVGSRAGESILTILRVILADSSKYTCTSGQQIYSFELTVLGKHDLIAWS